MAVYSYASTLANQLPKGIAKVYVKKSSEVGYTSLGDLRNGKAHVRSNATQTTYKRSNPFSAVAEYEFEMLQCSGIELELLDQLLSSDIDVIIKTVDAQYYVHNTTATRLGIKIKGVADAKIDSNRFILVQMRVGLIDSELDTVMPSSAPTILPPYNTNTFWAIGNKATATSSAITVDFASAGKTITRASGSFVTEGFVAGMIISISGAVDAGNNSAFTVTNVNVNGLAMTVSETVADETGDTGVTIIGTYNNAGLKEHIQPAGVNTLEVCAIGENSYSVFGDITNSSLTFESFGNDSDKLRYRNVGISFTGSFDAMQDTNTEKSNLKSIHQYGMDLRVFFFDDVEFRFSNITGIQWNEGFDGDFDGHKFINYKLDGNILVSDLDGVIN